jgi:hypothetical protein
MMIVFIDARLGNIAKHVGLLKPFDPLGPAGRHTEAGADQAFRFSAVDPGVMSQRVCEAIALTDASPSPQVGESFSAYRALALARLTPLAADA